MRAPWLTALATLALCTGAAYGQAYQYVARTAAPVARSGAVIAGVLTWQCSGSECRISGPWPAPGVGACADLAGQVGRIASYGRTGAMLGSAQLTQCNANLPAAGAVLQIDPQVAAQLRRRGQNPQLGPVHLGGGSSSSPSSPPPPAEAPTQVGVQPGGRPEDIVVHLVPSQSLTFTGVSPPSDAPTLPAPASPIVAGRIDTAGLRLQASAAAGSSTSPRPATDTPSYRLGATGAVILRVPVSLRDLPAEAYTIEVNCSLYETRYVPPPLNESAPERDLYVNDDHATPRVVGRGEGGAGLRTAGRFEGTFDIPMQLNPFRPLSDARSYGCTGRISITRPDGHLDSATLTALAGPDAPPSRAAYRPAAGTTPLLQVGGNIQ